MARDVLEKFWGIEKINILEHVLIMAIFAANSVFFESSANSIKYVEIYFLSKQKFAMTRFELRTSCMAGFCLIHMTISIVEDFVVLLNTYSKSKLMQTQIPEDLWLNWEYLMSINGAQLEYNRNSRKLSWFSLQK